MPNQISQIQVGNVTYDICDTTARDFVSSLTSSLTSPFMIIKATNGSNVSIPANTSQTFHFSLDNNLDSSYFILAPVGIQNNHSVGTTISTWFLGQAPSRDIYVGVRSGSSAFTFGAGNLILYLLVSNKELFSPTQGSTYNF